jgi:hypothetical protein
VTRKSPVQSDPVRDALFEAFRSWISHHSITLLRRQLLCILLGIEAEDNRQGDEHDETKTP